MPSHKNPWKQIVGWILIIAVVIGSYYGGLVRGRSQEIESEQFNAVVNKDTGKPDNVDFSLFWKAWKILDENYVPTGKAATSTTDQDRVYGAIQGMTAALGDPYTVFFPPTDNQNFQSEIDGNFEGVGMEMGIKDNLLTVIAPLKDSPAEKAGIKAGDQVIKINGQDSTSMTVDDAVNLIRGPKGTSVTITVQREGVDQPFDVKLTREVIDLPVLDSSYDQKTKIFTIHIYSFSTDSANLFRSALRSFVMTGSNKLIIDLRGNPGGILDSAVDIASWFLPPGDVVVQEDYGNGKPKTIERSLGYNIFNNNLKMVVLIDGGSASASEILAGALQEHGKATLVGTQSFGKGSVQELVNIDDKTALKVTIARWLTPNGKSISENGLTPDVEVKLTDDDVKNHNDAQMQKAIELLSQ